MESAVPVVPAVPDYSELSVRLARLVAERDRVAATIERSRLTEAEYRSKILHLLDTRDSLWKELDALNVSISALGGGRDGRGPRYYDPRPVLEPDGTVGDSH